LGYRGNLIKTLDKTEKPLDYFDPPWPLKVNVIGHSFPPSTQIFLPMIELNPSKEIIFTPSTINQSVYQTFIIKNNSDTPLYYKFMSDLSNIFRLYPKMGLIDPRSFNLILVEFCPKEIKTYISPLKIVFNHDLQSMHSLILYGFCCDPNIEIENAENDEIYFSPSFIGITNVKTVNIINKSPVKVNIQISTNFNNNSNNNFFYTSNANFNSIKSANVNNLTFNNSNIIKAAEKNEQAKPLKQSKLALMNYKENNNNNNNYINNNTGISNNQRKVDHDNNVNSNMDINTQHCLIVVSPNYFEMEPNQIKRIDISFCPLFLGNMETKLDICASRIHDPLQENQGIYNPGYSSQERNSNIKPDRRMFKKVLKIIGKGQDGELKIDPPLLDFGTVKVGFEKKQKFSIINPTICNFYTKLELDNSHLYDKILKLDFKEGFINSLCKKDVNLSFHPKSRANFDIKIKLYACEYKNDKTSNRDFNKDCFDESKVLKAEILVKANGDYPLLKICDVRNTNIGMSQLWELFNVDIVNEELLKKLTEEEIDFINNEKTNSKLQ